MTFFEYKVIPAPKRMKKVKGVRTGPDLFALTLTEFINDAARQGWEYLRAESMPAEEPAGWWRKPVEAEQTVLVFRRPRETVSVRPLPAETQGPEPTVRAEPARQARALEPASFGPKLRGSRDEGLPSDRRPAGGMQRREPIARQEPRFGPVEDEPAAAPTPLRPTPRLGPADQS